MIAKRHTLANALRAAADQYELDAAICVHTAGHGRMVDTFARQAAEARALADQIEQADFIRLED